MYQRNGISSKRETDMLRERNMIPELNKIYQMNGILFKRTPEIVDQFAGVDLLMKLEPDGEIMIVDEKARTAEDGGFNLPTFSMEIASRNNPGHNGWLVSKAHKTTHYAFIWPDSHDNFNTLDRVEICIVPRKSVLQLLADAGIHSKSDAIRYLNQHGALDSKGRPFVKLNRYVKLMLSKQLAEEPLNAIVNRDKLREIAIKTIYYEKEAKPMAS